MANTLKPGQDSGKQGGVYQQVGPQGGKQPNFTTVPDHRPMPPTSKPGHAWTPVKVTPDNRR